MTDTHTLSLNEGERQALLMALAHLAVDRPGWDDMLSAIASRVDNRDRGRPVMYDHFRSLHEDVTRLTRTVGHTLAPSREDNLEIPK